VRAAGRGPPSWPRGRQRGRPSAPAALPVRQRRAGSRVQPRRACCGRPGARRARPSWRARAPFAPRAPDFEHRLAALGQEASEPGTVGVGDDPGVGLGVKTASGRTVTGHAPRGGQAVAPARPARRTDPRIRPRRVTAPAEEGSRAASASTGRAASRIGANRSCRRLGDAIYAAVLDNRSPTLVRDPHPPQIQFSGTHTRRAPPSHRLRVD
jgi:hypothetical protein